MELQVLYLMKTRSISVFMILVTGMLVVPTGFSNAESDDQTNTASNNQTGTNQTNNFGQQVSDFVHQAMVQFKQQREDTINAIKECHEKIKNATPENKTQIRDDCKATLKSIREKYHDERKQFNELFKEYRQGIKFMIMKAGGMHFDTQDKEKALEHMKELKENKMQMGYNHTNGMQEKFMGKGLKTRNNTNCVNPPIGAKIC